MQNLFGLTFFILLILSIVGIFKPSIVKQTNRLKGFLYPFAGSFLSLALIGVFSPTPKVEQIEKPKKVKQIEKPKVEQIEKPKKVEQIEKPKVEQIEKPKVEQVEKPKVKQVEKPKVKQVEKPKVEWYMNGTLHKATVKEWINATEENKLATTSDWVFSVPQIREKIEDGSRSVDSIKPFAESIVSCVDTATEGMPKNSKVAEAGALCIFSSVN